MAAKARKFVDIKQTAKVRNHPQAVVAKVEVRRHVLEAIGRERAVVFDAFAGAGEMFRGIWSEASAYAGCDNAEWMRDDRLMFVADNRRVLRAVDLAPFTIFDLDAFGSPWEQAIIVAARRKVAVGETIGLVMTERSGLNLKQGGMPNPLRELTGLKGRMPGLPRWHDDIIDRAIGALAARMNCRVARRWQAQRKAGAAMFYIGLVLEGNDGKG